MWMSVCQSGVLASSERVNLWLRMCAGFNCLLDFSYRSVSLRSKAKSIIQSSKTDFFVLSWECV